MLKDVYLWIAKEDRKLELKSKDFKRGQGRMKMTWRTRVLLCSNLLEARSPYTYIQGVTRLGWEKQG